MARSAYHAFNERLAVWITNHTGTMECAYIFFGIGVGSLVGYFTGNVFLAAVCGATSSYLLQLVLLPVIQLGQQVQGRKQELAIDQAHKNTEKSLHNDEQMMRHLNAQDEKILAIERINLQQTTHILTILNLLAHHFNETPPDTPTEPLPPFPRDAKGRFVTRIKRTSDPLPAVE